MISDTVFHALRNDQGEVYAVVVVVYLLLDCQDSGFSIIHHEEVKP